MKCKDCIHYAAHKHFYFGEEDFDEYFNDDKLKIILDMMCGKEKGKEKENDD